MPQLGAAGIVSLITGLAGAGAGIASAVSAHGQGKKYEKMMDNAQKNKDRMSAEISAGPQPNTNEVGLGGLGSGNVGLKSIGMNDPAFSSSPSKNSFSGSKWIGHM